MQKNPVPQSVCTKSDCSAGLSGVTAVSTYDESACAVSNGAVKCWGTNSGGALGDGTTTTSQGFVAIVVDKANRNIRCWGGEFGSLCATGLPAGDRTTLVSPQW